MDDDIIDEQIMNSVINEVRALIKTHKLPNVVQMVGFEYNDESVFIMMDMIKGGSLDQLLESYRSWKKIKTCSAALETEENQPNFKILIAELVLAVFNLHKIGIAHGDISEVNIMLDESGHLQLIDFGESSFNITPSPKISQ
uniref:non-specific serine/threonine protein kinase n=1 Tax=Ditylenchus dipsaci TaxID=166011 RepID=A0A915ESF2_9BILA